MDIVEQVNLWAKGDALQGKIMFGLGIVVAICLIGIFKADNSILKGMIIPLSLLLLANLGYGVFLAGTRVNHAIMVTQNYEGNPQEVISKELVKAERDNKNYSAAKPIWAVLILLSLGMYFFIDREYYKGLSIGIMVLCVALIIIDTMLHHRLKPYLETLRELSGSF